MHAPRIRPSFSTSLRSIRRLSDLLNLCRILTLLACWTALLWGPSLSAQEASPEEASGESSSSSRTLFFDTVDVNVVNIEVMVTDKNGEPVTDLKREDFQIFENGLPVEVSNFFRVNGQEAAAGEQLEALPEETVAGPETKQLKLVIFVDNVHVNLRDRNTIFTKLREFLRSDFDPSGEIMLASTNGTVQIDQEFTNDIGRIEAALDRMELDLGQANPLEIETRQFMTELKNAELIDEGQATSFNKGGELQDGGGDFQLTVNKAERLGQTAKHLSERRYQMVRGTIDALGQFTDTLAGLPGRKAILYLSDGLHLRASDSLSEAFWVHYRNWITRNGSTPAGRRVERVGRELEAMRLDATRDFRELVEYASGNKVAFYPLSNLGRSASYASPEFGGGDSGVDAGAFSSTFAASDSLSRESSLLQMADGTGGRALTRTNNIAQLMTTIQNDFSQFYSLGFNSTEPIDQARFHKVQVKVNRPGVTVRHFRGHLPKDPLDHLQALTLSAIRHQLVDNPLGVELVPAGEQSPVAERPNRFRVPLMLQIPFNKLLLLPQEAAHVGRVSLFVIVLDEKSDNTSKPQHIELPIQVPAEQMAQAGSQAIGYPLNLEMSKGKKRIAIGVRDHLAKLDATLQLEVAVGDAI